MIDANRKKIHIILPFDVLFAVKAAAKLTVVAKLIAVEVQIFDFLIASSGEISVPLSFKKSFSIFLTNHTFHLGYLDKIFDLGNLGKILDFVLTS